MAEVKAKSYFECSAKTGAGVNDMLETAVRDAIRRKIECRQYMARQRLATNVSEAAREAKQAAKQAAKNAGRRASGLFCYKP